MMTACHLGEIKQVCTVAEAYLRPLFESTERTAVAGWVKASILVVPVAGAVHLVALAVLGGAVFLADLRALGGGIRTLSPARTIHYMRWIFRVGLTLAVLSGITVALGEMMKLFYSPPFWLKSCALLAALVFTIGSRRAIYVSNALSPRAIVFGAFALLVWGLGVGILAGGSAYLALAVLIVVLAIGATMGARSTTALHSVTASISITLWLTVAASGRWIAFY